MDQQQPMQFQANEEVMRGRYANNVMIAFTPEEFILDFMLMSQSANNLVGRIVLSPGHIKRMADQLQSLIKTYEEQKGPLAPAAEPKEMGFRTS